MASSQPSSYGLLLNYLRPMTFDFTSETIERSQRVAIVKQVLDISPNLSHLVVAWDDLRRCSQTYSNLKHIHLLLERLYPEPKQHVNVRRLNQLAPHICCLETSGASIMFNQNLVQFVLKIICRFQQLVNLTLNKDSLYRSEENKKVMFKESLIVAGSGRLFDGDNIHIEFPIYDKLCIWF
jgi:hypothetical protein